MKKLLFIYVLLMSCSNEKTFQSKAEAAALKYLSENLNDYKSYSSVSFTELENDSTSFSEELSYLKAVSDSCDAVVGAMEAAWEIEKYLSDRQDTIKPCCVTEKATRDSAQSTIMSLSASGYGKTFKGYFFHHKFRAKNAFGTTIIQDYSFYFDKDLNIISVYNSDGERIG